MYTNLMSLATVRRLPIHYFSFITCCSCGQEHAAYYMFADTLGRAYCEECVGDTKIASIYELGLYELTQLLDKLDIPYEEPVGLLGGKQIRFNWCDGDVICHKGSYGGDAGLLETMGFMMDDGDVNGFLTAMKALEIILHEWNNR